MRAAIGALVLLAAAEVQAACPSPAELLPDRAGDGAMTVYLPQIVHLQDPSDGFASAFSLGPDGGLVAGEVLDGGAGTTQLLFDTNGAGAWSLCVECIQPGGATRDVCGPTFEVELGDPYQARPRRYDRSRLGKTPCPTPETTVELDIGEADRPAPPQSICITDPFGEPAEGTFELEFVTSDAQSQRVTVEGPSVVINALHGRPDTVQILSTSLPDVVLPGAIRTYRATVQLDLTSPRGSWPIGFQATRKKGMRGARIVSIAPGSPADRAGLQPGEVLADWSGLRWAGTFGSRAQAPEGPPGPAGFVRVVDASRRLRRVELEFGTESRPFSYRLTDAVGRASAAGGEPLGELPVGLLRGTLLPEGSDHTFGPQTMVWFIQGADTERRVVVSSDGRFALRYAGKEPGELWATRQDPAGVVTGPRRSRPANGWPETVRLEIDLTRRMVLRGLRLKHVTGGGYVQASTPRLAALGLEPGVFVRSVGGRTPERNQLLFGPDDRPLSMRIRGYDGAERRIEVPWIEPPERPDNSAYNPTLLAENADSVVVRGRVHNAHVGDSSHPRLAIRGCFGCGDVDLDRMLRASPHVADDGTFLVVAPATGNLELVAIRREARGVTMSEPVRVPLEGPQQYIELVLPDRPIAGLLGVVVRHGRAEEPPHVDLRSGLPSRWWQGPPTPGCLEHGDLVLAIDGTPLEEVPAEELHSRIYGLEGSTVVLSVEHADGTRAECAETRRLKQPSK